MGRVRAARIGQDCHTDHRFDSRRYVLEIFIKKTFTNHFNIQTIAEINQPASEHVKSD
jgi:hypothetical protein